jgi:hypothetical protein
MALSLYIVYAVAAGEMTDVLKRFGRKRLWLAGNLFIEVNWRERFRITSEKYSRLILV